MNMIKQCNPSFKAPSDKLVYSFFKWNPDLSLRKAHVLQRESVSVSQYIKDKYFALLTSDFEDLSLDKCAIFNCDESVFFWTAEMYKYIAYHEGNFSARYTSTIRSVSCALLIEDNETRPRCRLCVKYGKCLRQKRKRHEKLLNSDVDFTKSTYKHTDMPREILIRKLQQLNKQIRSLQQNVERLERQINKQIIKEGASLDKFHSAEMMDLMQLCKKEVKQSYPDSTSFQSLFWAQQLKAVSN